MVLYKFLWLVFKLLVGVVCVFKIFFILCLILKFVWYMCLVIIKIIVIVKWWWVIFVNYKFWVCGWKLFKKVKMVFLEFFEVLKICDVVFGFWVYIV